MSVVIFSGRPGHSSQLGSHLSGGLLLAAAIGLLGVLLIERGMHVHDATQTAGFLATGVLTAAGLVLILRGVLRVVSRRYRIDDLRVEVESGLLRRKVDNLDLWRVKDIRFRQGLFQRMLGTGDVELDTSDTSDHVLVLHGIPGARAIYDRLRDAIDAARRTRGVVAVESDTVLTR